MSDLGHIFLGTLRCPVVPRCDEIAHRTEVLTRLCEAQNWRCCYCGISMRWASGRGHDAATIEHVIPKSAGGPISSWWNLVAACNLCNSSRASMNAEKYLQLVVCKGRRKAALYAQRLRKRIQGRRVYGQHLFPPRHADRAP